ncbi:hypothetical protein C0991_002100 [Blastosporella zonata]|nr:hypothetical protein C0991_002100 [Blastosporella zonata]
MRTLTPDSSVSPSSSHKRRKSTSSDIVERRPKKGDNDYIKRPENAFILFRRKCCEDRQAAQEEASSDSLKKPRQADLSKTISQQWRSLSTDERQYWEQLAKEKKKEHEALHPNYVYRPQRAKDKNGRSISRKPKGRRGSECDEPDSDGVSFMVPVVAPHHRHHGRSASAPTPPPYQSIQVPNVYHMTPSCPTSPSTSPSLLPMISRRSSHPDHEDPMSFDFHPSYTQPSAFGGFEIQPSEFLQGMFSMAGLQTRESLHPLDVSPEIMLLPAHQFPSPSSSVGTSSSGPSSPYNGPLTPYSAMLPNGYDLPNEGSFPAPGSQAEFDLMQRQQEDAQFTWTTTDPWQSNSEQFHADDFDISSIPNIELGVSKSSETQLLGNEMEYSCPSQDYMEPTHFSEQGMMAFDQMMANHGF